MSSRYDQPSEDPRDLTTPQADGDDGEPRLSEHAITLLQDEGDWRASCACGWLSLPNVTFSDAARHSCPILEEYVVSAERRREMRMRHATR